MTVNGFSRIKAVYILQLQFVKKKY